MTVLIPQIRAKLYRHTGTDQYGNGTYGSHKLIGIGVVRLYTGAKKTSVRADSSATRGGSQEQTVDAVLLFESRDEPGFLDRVEVSGMRLKIIGYQPRYDLEGNLAHWQVDLMTDAG